jgi:MFS family permease
MLVLSMVRSGRTLLLPLWGQTIGLDAAGIGLVVGISSAGDTLMFYPAGLVSDRKGRKWSAVSCLVMLSLGMAMIPLAHTLGSFMLVGLLVGLGNGMGSGINMTLGADFAADSEPGVFLGAWRLVTDVGGAAAPFVIGAVTGALALGPAALLIAALGLAGGGFHAAVVPETLKKPSRDSSKRSID